MRIDPHPNFKRQIFIDLLKIIFEVSSTLWSQQFLLWSKFRHSRCCCWRRWLIITLMSLYTVRILLRRTKYTDPRLFLRWILIVLREYFLQQVWLYSLRSWLTLNTNNPYIKGISPIKYSTCVMQRKVYDNKSHDGLLSNVIGEKL